MLLGVVDVILAARAKKWYRLVFSRYEPSDDQPGVVPFRSIYDSGDTDLSCGAAVSELRAVEVLIDTRASNA